MSLPPRTTLNLGLILLLALAAPARAETPPPAPAATTYEAESATLAGGAAVVADAAAGGGHAVRLTGPAALVWNVTLPQAGRYELHFRYRSRAADTAHRLGVNGVWWNLGFIRTGGDWLEMSRVFPLAAGANRLELAAGDGEIEIDRLRFTAWTRDEPAPLYELAVLTPRQNAAYASAPRPLAWLLQRNGHRLAALQLDGEPVAATAAPYPFLPDTDTLTLAPERLAAEKPGRHLLTAVMDDGTRCESELAVAGHPLLAPLLIVTLDVGHGKSTLLRLPDGGIALIDTGTAAAAQERIVPFLRRHGLRRIDHLLLTHYHDDHVGGRQAVEAACTIGQVCDYRTYRTGDRFALGGVAATVLNAWDGGTDENSRSLALRLDYNGFVYSDGGDTYGDNQRRVLERSPELVRADVYAANHHFHGSLDVAFLRRVDPVVCLVSADETVYARGAFMQLYQPEVAGYLKAHDGRLRETLLTREVGTIVIRARGRDDWSYETYADPRTCTVPGLGNAAPDR